MQKLNFGVRALLACFLAAGWFASAAAQERTLPEDEFYGDVKRVLMSHYTGKIIRTKLPFPATRRGLELVDGALQNNAVKDPPQPAAKAGDELMIKSFKVTDSNIELLFAKNEPPPKRRVANPFSVWRQPRINLRFTRELNVKDLTVENINRLLAPAVDISTLTMPSAEAQTAPAAVNGPAAPETAAKPADAAIPQNAPTPTIAGDLPSAGPNIGELTIESSAKDARIYIDGSYSGVAPRTLRLRTGLHTVLIVKEGFEVWEQRLFIPGAKISVLRAELHAR